LKRSAADVIHALRQWDRGCMVRERHLYRGAVTKFDSTIAAALAVSPQARTEAQWKTVALSELLLSEVRASEFLVIAARLVEGSLPDEIIDWSEHIGAAAEACRHKPESHKVAIVVGEDQKLGTDAHADAICSLLHRSLKRVDVAEVAFVEADPNGYPLRQAPLIMIASRQIMATG
jgi:hypothetical protein